MKVKPFNTVTARCDRNTQRGRERQGEREREREREREIISVGLDPLERRKHCTLSFPRFIACMVKTTNVIQQLKR